MSVTAPLRVPVEIRRVQGAGAVPSARWFRLATGVSEAGLFFFRALLGELADETARRIAPRFSGEGARRLFATLAEDGRVRSGGDRQRILKRVLSMSGC